MKKIISILLIMCSCFFIAVGCGNPNKTVKDVEDYYDSIVLKYTNEEIKFFGETTNKQGKTVVISYNKTEVIDKISSSENNEIVVRFNALNEIQANLLKYIFRYYENWNENFYSNISLYDYEQKEINMLYEKIHNLDIALEQFKKDKEEFEEDIIRFALDGSEIMAVNQYTYKYNILIEKCFDFAEYFRDLHFKYIFGENATITNVNAGQRLLDEAYLYFAKYVYYSNVKPLNYSTGINGFCDQLDLMQNRSNNYVLINSLSNKLQDLGENIKGKLCQTIFDEDLTNKLFNINYVSGTFKQGVENYINLYYNMDNYILFRVELNLVDGLSLATYINNLSKTEKVAYDNQVYLLNFLYPKYLNMIDELKY